MTLICEVATCDHCHRPFIYEEEGDGLICYECRDLDLYNGAWGHQFQPVNADQINDNEADA